jgi:hypothetical protein
LVVGLRLISMLGRGQILQITRSIRKREQRRFRTARNHLDYVADVLADQISEGA